MMIRGLHMRVFYLHYFLVSTQCRQSNPKERGLSPSQRWYVPPSGWTSPASWRWKHPFSLPIPPTSAPLGLGLSHRPKGEWRWWETRTLCCIRTTSRWASNVQCWEAKRKRRCRGKWRLAEWWDSCLPALGTAPPEGIVCRIWGRSETHSTYNECHNMHNPQRLIVKINLGF